LLFAIGDMQSLSDTDILDLWERGAGLHAIDQALLVLSHVLPEHTFDYLTTLPLGQRDALLFQVQRRTFGDRLDAYTECPECRERLEFSLSCDLLSSYAMPSEVSTKTVTIQGGDFTLRCLNSRDAAAAASSEDVEAAKKILLSLCAAPAAGSMQDNDSLPEATEAAIAAELASMDPRAETLLDLVCPACGHAWQGIFEITTFLWTEIRVRARRLLQEVDALARAYGWPEGDILAMSEARRGLYVQMAIA
jgi:hypothetical protein